ncbi:hypothetical protein FOCG_08850 [Fusarium oxysporum f. sp. radicis-lycopersici 26381]|uniref:Uncharacterized protein n=1 Tax=Fusarium oxysporum Fo47 TaxID=660027 RepID=W9K3R1_FUSOX|nr:hypothetical protein FOZG_08257 [Fusarium oxysporum Fo47]EWZ83999.1 hypothetical protein FOWG_12844 [Fusarium oxysporum f. sp. lycopersici MN25]EXL50592.1 hypothetical protein FOCG_08850 [Fusarium oxysporum f. sp. radicis-lycopersici 26381]
MQLGPRYEMGLLFLARLELNKTRQDKTRSRPSRAGGKGMDLGESTSRPSHPITSLQSKGFPLRDTEGGDMPTVKVAGRNVQPLLPLPSFLACLRSTMFH